MDGGGLFALGLTQNRSSGVALPCVQAYCLRQRALLEQFCVSPVPELNRLIDQAAEQVAK